MRLRRRDVAPSVEIYECPETKIQTLKYKEGYKTFVLLSPIRCDKVIVDTGELDEDDEPILEIKSRPITTTYLEKVGSIASSVKVEEEPSDDIEEETFVDEDDCFRYLFMGSQQWLVIDAADPNHKFRKEIRFRMESSFSAESERKKKKATERLSNNLPDIDSQSSNEFQRKDKKVLKQYGGDDYLFF